MGRPVRVALLDGAVDTRHPHLRVARALTTYGERAGDPSAHATHAAGIIAGRAPDAPGLCPEAELVSVKVCPANMVGRPRDVVDGIDAVAALDAVDLVVLGVGFNQLPRGARGGHGWRCAAGDCALCAAVERLVAARGVLVIAPVGNYHLDAEHLRAADRAAAAQGVTDVCCPAAARGVLAVGGTRREDALPLASCSRGPTADGRAKPDVLVPAQDVVSTVPVERGAPASCAPYAAHSGSSVAAALVAGVAAAMIHAARARGRALDAREVCAALMRADLRAAAAPVLARRAP